MNKAIELNPNYEVALRSKAEVLIQDNQYQNGINCYKEIINKYNELIIQNKINYDDAAFEIAWSMINLSTIYLDNMINIKKSIFYANEALKTYSSLKNKEAAKESYILDHRAMIYFKNGENEKALADIFSAIEIDSENRNLYSRLVNYYLTVKEYEKAIETIDKTIEMDHDDPDGYYKESLIYYDQKDYLNSLIYVSNAILKSEEEDRLANGDYYISDLNNIDRITLDELYAFRAELFSILGNNKSACRDYIEVKNLKKGEIDPKVEVFISNYCE